jgi:hypothetical protein
LALGQIGPGRNKNLFLIYGQDGSPQPQRNEPFFAERAESNHEELKPGNCEGNGGGYTDISNARNYMRGMRKDSAKNEGAGDMRFQTLISRSETFRFALHIAENKPF